MGSNHFRESLAVSHCAAFGSTAAPRFYWLSRLLIVIAFAIPVGPHNVNGQTSQCFEEQTFRYGRGLPGVFDNGRVASFDLAAGEHEFEIFGPGGTAKGLESDGSISSLQIQKVLFAAPQVLQSVDICDVMFAEIPHWNPQWDQYLTGTCVPPSYWRFLNPGGCFSEGPCGRFNNLTMCSKPNGREDGWCTVHSTWQESFLSLIPVGTKAEFRAIGEKFIYTVPALYPGYRERVYFSWWTTTWDRDIYGAARVRHYFPQVLVTISPTEVQPARTSGTEKTNQLTSGNVSTISISTIPKMSEVEVELSVEYVDNSGGHITTHHGTPRQSSGGFTLNPTVAVPANTEVQLPKKLTVVTGADGRVTAYYNAGVVAGIDRVIARTKDPRIAACGAEFSEEVIVCVQGLNLLTSSPIYDRIGGRPAHPGPPISTNDLNHWGVDGLLQKLQAAADDVFTATNGSYRLAINDISLPCGGKFDVSGNWIAGAHGTHRVGTSADIRSQGAPPDVWTGLVKEFGVNNVEIHDSGTPNEHFHVYH